MSLWHDFKVGSFCLPDSSRTDAWGTPGRIFPWLLASLSPDLSFHFSVDRDLMDWGGGAVRGVCRCYKDLEMNIAGHREGDGGPGHLCLLYDSATGCDAYCHTEAIKWSERLII